MSDFKTDVERVQIMIYSTCGCSLKEGREVLRECLNRNTTLHFAEQLKREVVDEKRRR